MWETCISYQKAYHTSYVHKSTHAFNEGIVFITSVFITRHKMLLLCGYSLGSLNDKCETIEGYVLYAGGDCGLYLNGMLLVQVMAYVMSGTFAHRYSGALDMRTRIRPADWCARSHDIAGGWDLCRRLESQSSRTVS